MAELSEDNSCCAKEKTETNLSQGWIRQYLPAIVSLLFLASGILLNYFKVPGFHPYFEIILYLIAYLVVGWKVLLKAIQGILKGEVFGEHFLMSLATLGAFAIHEYPEAVTVMLFYEVGELFQDAAINRSKRSIQALLDIRPQIASVWRDDRFIEVAPSTVVVGDRIQIVAGGKAALDGLLLNETAFFDTAALTGESRPVTLKRGDQVLAGMINLNHVLEIKVTRLFKDSALSKILELVQNAAEHKSKTQLFITRFAKIYTPIVVFLAIALAFVPALLVENYAFQVWLYRALVFLVISCPCALVISIPLGYFGGIGLASRNGILIKGSNYLDVLTEIDTVVMDKTGTLTKGVFKVQKMEAINYDREQFIRFAGALESKSSHPAAKAIVEYAASLESNLAVSQTEEISGHGLQGIIDGKEVLAGNGKLLKKYGISYDDSLDSIADTIVLIAIDKKFSGYFLIADEIKEDAADTIQSLHDLGIQNIVMLSGDKGAVVKRVAEELGIDFAYGDLLPEDKVAKVEELKRQGRKIIFVGDGVNDAPVLALADVGMAMGGLGSDAAIETSDVVIQTDQPSRIATAIRIGKATKRTVRQNISLAFGVKLLFLILGGIGVATLWEAVFADMGVALLAIFNAVRLQKKDSQS